MTIRSGRVVSRPLRAGQRARDRGGRQGDRQDEAQDGTAAAHFLFYLVATLPISLAISLVRQEVQHLRMDYGAGFGVVVDHQRPRQSVLERTPAVVDEDQEEPG